MKYGIKNLTTEFAEDYQGKMLMLDLFRINLRCDSLIECNEAETEQEEFMFSLSPQQHDLLNCQLELWNQMSQERRNEVMEGMMGQGGEGTNEGKI